MAYQRKWDRFTDTEKETFGDLIKKRDWTALREADRQARSRMAREDIWDASKQRYITKQDKEFEKAAAERAKSAEKHQREMDKFSAMLAKREKKLETKHPKHKPPNQEQDLDVSGSTCFSGLSYDPTTSTATGTFRRTGTTYDFSCTHQQWKEWKADESRGGYYNSEIAD